MNKFDMMSKDALSRVEEIMNATKLNEFLHRKEEEEKQKNCILWILAIIGIVAAVAAIAYGVYRFFTPDYLEDFEDDFDDDFDDDFFEDESDEKEKKETALPPLEEGEQVTAVGFAPLQHFTQPPARYTDATLIRTMEENGIGRPSTYAPTVSTILDDLRPRVRHQGGQVPAPDTVGRRGQRPDVPAVPGHRGCKVHRPYGAEAGRCGGRPGQVEGPDPPVLCAVP